MSTRKNWARDWKTLKAPKREECGLFEATPFSAQFGDDAGHMITVRIKADELKTFDEAPPDLLEKRQHTEEVMRAVLETYMKEYGIPQGDIEPSDLGPHLEPLRQEFRKNV